MFELPSPLHPMLVHFPIALFIVALGMEVLSLIMRKESLHQSAVHIFIIAALLTPLVVKAGIWEVEKLRLNHPVLDRHRFYALLTMWTSLASLPLLYLVREKCVRYFRIIFLVFLISAVSFVSIAAKKGGQMVYEYGIGIEE